MEVDQIGCQCGQESGCCGFWNIVLFFQQCDIFSFLWGMYFVVLCDKCGVFFCLFFCVFDNGGCMVGDSLGFQKQGDIVFKVCYI